ncbi:MAG: tetratricopeptide repeat protein [Clostridiales bacterium]|nr:tetratricopeptide repeat protein [Clostridiales bacterium]
MMKKQWISLVLTAVIGASVFNMTGCSAQRSAKDYYQSGMKCLAGGSYEEAEKYFGMALDKKKDKAEYYIADGFAYMKLGDYEKARAQFDRAVLDKENQIVWENNKIAYRGKALSYYEENDYENALVFLDKALKISAKKEMDTDLLSYKGDILYRMGKYTDAKEVFSDILKSEKKNSMIYQKRALVYEKLEQTEQAQSDLNQALKYDKKNRELYIQKYLLLNRIKKEDEAKKVLEKALNLKVKTARDSCYYGRFLYYSGRHKEAVEQLEKAWDDGAYEAYYFLGMLLNEQGDLDKAKLCYQKYTEKDKSGSYAAAAYNCLGLICANQNDYSNALSWFQKGLEKRDANESRGLQYNLVIALEKMGDYDRAELAAREYVDAYGSEDGMKQELDFIESRVKEGKTSNE